MSKLARVVSRRNLGSGRRMGSSASNPGPGEKWVIDDTPNPIFTVKGLSIIGGVLGVGIYLRELRKDDNNFISAYINKKMYEQCEKAWRDEVFILQTHHQAMMEHIERKKFVKYPLLPTYKSMFHYPTYQLNDKVLPGNVDN